MIRTNQDNWNVQSFKDDEQLRKTIEYLQDNQIEQFYPCHCVSLLARAKIMKKLPVIENGVG